MAKNYRSQLVGVFGYPVDENPTGVMEEAAFKVAGLDYRYITMKVEPEKLKEAIEGMKAVNMRGVNLTIPHKVNVLKYLDELSDAARLIGAVNTIINDDGKLYGENSDGKGFVRALKEEGVEIAGKKVTILGAGGAARSIAVELALEKAREIIIVNRNEDRGSAVSKIISDNTNTKSRYDKWLSNHRIDEDSDILVNATSVGLYPNVNEKPDIDYSLISDKMVVCDVIFNDPNSLFLQKAKEKGAKTIDGLGMLAYQGEINFKLWTNVEAPKGVMKEQLKKEFGLK